MRTCIWCKHDIYDDAYVYCPECGMKITENDEFPGMNQADADFKMNEVVLATWTGKNGKIYREPARVVNAWPVLSKHVEVFIQYEIILIGDLLAGMRFTIDEDRLSRYANKPDNPHQAKAD